MDWESANNHRHRRDHHRRCLRRGVAAREIAAMKLARLFQGHRSFSASPSTCSFLTQRPKSERPRWSVLETFIRLCSRTLRRQSGLQIPCGFKPSLQVRQVSSPRRGTQISWKQSRLPHVKWTPELNIRRFGAIHTLKTSSNTPRSMMCISSHRRPRVAAAAVRRRWALSPTALRTQRNVSKHQMRSARSGERRRLESEKRPFET
mmetsp:Transcript_13434/g.15390  ORF Transcript_13434/g.15390 Transcript_13434/m.15390 type:complete len:205 (+) Transcript_13434:410-1024(+)